MTILAYVAQALVIAVLFYRRGWRNTPVLFFVELAESALMIADCFIPRGTWAAYEFWHDSQKAYIVLSMVMFGAYALKNGSSFPIALLSLLNAYLGFALYSGLDLDCQMFPGGSLYLAYFLAGAFLDLYIAWSVYTFRVGKPHEETVCQSNQSDIPIPNR